MMIGYGYMYEWGWAMLKMFPTECQEGSMTVQVVQPGTPVAG